MPGDGSWNRSWARLCDLEQGSAVDSGLSDLGTQKGDYFRAFRDGSPGVKWDVISKNSRYLASGNPFFCFQCFLLSGLSPK